MKRFVGAALAACLALWPIASSAQTQNPVTQHYRAYNAAMQRGDLAAAEDAAALALAASEARDGDGGATVVLAANLAQVRLDRGRAAEALGPAQRARQLAESNANSPVNPNYARLLVGRAELSRAVANEPSLIGAIQAAEAAGGFEAEVYDAGLMLGQWALEHRRFAIAADAYGAAVRASAGEEEGQAIARASALVGRGAALLLADRGRESGTQRNSGGQATRLIDRPSEDAPRAFVEALRLVAPLAARPAPGNALTRAQNTYASALAWNYVSVSWFRSMGFDLPADVRDARGGMLLDLAPDDGKPACAYSLVSDPDPRYPPEAEMDFGVGAVTLRAITDATGAVQEMRPVAGAGGQQFIDAISAVAGRWRLRRREDTPPDCSAQVMLFIPFYFYME